METPDRKPTERKLLEQRLAALKNERSLWETDWKLISRRFQPRLGRFFVDEHVKTYRNDIYDNTGLIAARTLASGLMGGATSPARPWFKLRLADEELNKSQNVKVWLQEFTDLLLRVFSSSNTYRVLHHIYYEKALFGVNADIVVPNFHRVLWHYPMTIGEFYLGQDFDGNVDTVYREFNRSCIEIVREFGIDKVSQSIKNAYNAGNYQTPFTIRHAIEPRRERDPKKIDSMNMPFSSIYWEKGAPKDTLLRASGFRRFRALAPRWDVVPGEVYGWSPAMDALGDGHQLQHQQVRKGQAIDYSVQPPLRVPTGFDGREVNMLPGGITYSDGTDSIKSMWEVRTNMQHLLEDIVDIRSRIKTAFYTDLFLMISSAEQTGRTAYEIAQRQEEKLLMLGPTIERLHNELLQPLVEMAIEIVVEKNMVPSPPPEINNVPVNVEFTSLLAQAQRAIGSTAVERYVMNLGVVAKLKPDVLDTFNSDVWSQKYSDMLGVDPEMIIAGDQLAFIRDSRNKAMAAQSQAAMLGQQSQVTKNFADAGAAASKMAAGGDMMNQFSGYNSPSALEVAAQ